MYLTTVVFASETAPCGFYKEIFTEPVAHQQTAVNNCIEADAVRFCSWYVLERTHTRVSSFGWVA